VRVGWGGTAERVDDDGVTWQACWRLARLRGITGWLGKPSGAQL